MIRDEPRHPTRCSAIYASVDRAERHLGRQPAVPRLHPGRADQGEPAFDMLVSCASIQGISWLEASGAIAAENTVLRADRRRGRAARRRGRVLRLGRFGGQPLGARRGPRDREERPGAGAGRRSRVVVGTDAHSSIVNTLRLLEMDALVVDDARPPAHRAPRCAPRWTATTTCPTSRRSSARPARRTPASSTTSLASAPWPRSAAGGSTSTARTAAPVSSPASSEPKYDGIELADSFILDPHKWLFTPFDCCALLYREPALARADPHPGRVVPRRDPRRPTASGTRPTTPTT